MPELSQADDMMSSLAGAPPPSPASETRPPSMPEPTSSPFEEIHDVGEEELAVTESKRFILFDYFKQMNNHKVYPLNVVVSREEIEKKRDIEDFFTGERRSQETGEIDVVTKEPIIVSVYFPSCIVTPPQQTFDPDVSKKILTFYVMTMTNGKQEGTVVFSQGNTELESITLEYKVVDQRFAKLASLAGITVGAVPPVADFLFGININEQIITNLEVLLPVLTSSTLVSSMLTSMTTSVPRAATICR